ncbi:MAG: hypothetical protein HQL26_03095 [Candidatus Omnitrophica bacterium]|nr:hypothetical protein [Candidatus Omnitrophota bacterium]
MIKSTHDDFLKEIQKISRKMECRWEKNEEIMTKFNEDSIKDYLKDRKHPWCSVDDSWPIGDMNFYYILGINSLLDSEKRGGEKCQNSC